MRISDGSSDVCSSDLKKGDVCAVPTDDGGTMFVVGLGKAADVDPSVLRHAAGCLARAAKGHEAIAIDLLRSLDDVGDMARGAQDIAEGLALGGYQYTTFNSKSETSKLTRAASVGGGGKRTQTAIDSGRSEEQTPDTTSQMPSSYAVFY